jgi:outer membrane protein, multidrug efflux system
MPRALRQSIRHLGALACVLASVLNAACAVHPSAMPAPEAPPRFDQAVAAPAHWPLANWYREFRSDELNQLIDLALSANLDLAVAESAVRQADARARAAGAAILPHLDAVGDVAQYDGRARGQSGNETDWEALLSASYEVDFWGRLHQQHQSARFSELSSRADRDTVALTIAAGVASTYFQLLALRERERLTQLTFENAQHLQQAIEARYRAGAANADEVAAQRATVASAQLLLPALQAQEEQARMALALLVGRAPEGFSVSGGSLDSLALPDIGPGLPAELLQRRPDVLSAEASLRAAKADVAAARAAFFPTLSLTLGAGIQNPAVQAALLTLAGTGPGITLTSSLVQTIFDGGQRRAARDAALANQEQLLAVYRRTVFEALEDVETSLSTLHQLDMQIEAQAQFATASEQALQAAQSRYRSGADDFSALLQTQRVWYGAQTQTIEFRLARLQALVSLCKALGGGWHAAAS